MSQNQTINGATWKEMLLYGASLLASNKAMVDELNVFPVPDGDTGTNMSMTMTTAIKELTAVTNESSVGTVSTLIARGALRGARGNSGVILSQIFRGISQALDGKEEIDAQSWANALENGAKSAYKAVMKPKEGTILTVIRYVGEKVQEDYQNGVELYGLIANTVTHAGDILQKTPDMLPVLKEAGVVDSGGMGLLIIFKGFKACLDGETLDEMGGLELGFSASDVPTSEASTELFSENDDVISVESEDDILNMYCTEFFVEHLKENIKQADIDNLLAELLKIGDSVVVVNDEDLVKVHLHTNMPGKALQLALQNGELGAVKIENMKEQHRQMAKERKAKQKEFGMVTIAAGDGFDKLFKDLGVDVVISGGQTMNPSAEDIKKAILKANARHVFVLPNNKNIIMAANQAAQMLEDQEESVHVIPTTTVMQAVSAALVFADAETVADKEMLMKQAIEDVTSGSVTYAVRNTTVQGHKIKKNDLMGMIEDDIISNGSDMNQVLDETLDKMMENDGEFISIFYGHDVSAEDASIFAKRVEQKYPEADVVVQEGGQPIYYYLLSVE